MKIAIIGTGYVGLPSSIAFAELGNDVLAVDLDEAKIVQLIAGNATLHEDGLEAMLKTNLTNKRLKFTTSLTDAVAFADLIIIAVGTPTKSDSMKADLSQLEQLAESLAPLLTAKHKLIAIKSTVPVGTGDRIAEKLIKLNPEARFELISLPEFLREGKALHDFFYPDRIIVGGASSDSQEIITHLYQAINAPTIFTSRRSAELIKYAANAFLAIKINYINEVADFCEVVGADIDEVIRGLGSDSRIGEKSLKPGPGYGGSCFPKDTNALVASAAEYGVRLYSVEEAIIGNQKRFKRLAQKIITRAEGFVNRKLAVLGLAFKAGTDDTRYSPAIEIIKELLPEFQISVYDPEAMESARQQLSTQVTYATSVVEALDKAAICVILTEWEEFKNLSPLPKIIFDYRNILEDYGTSEYYSIGR